MVGFPFNPEFVLGDIRETIMLAEISEFFVDMAPNVTAVNNPYLQIAPFIDLFDIR